MIYRQKSRSRKSRKQSRKTLKKIKKVENKFKDFCVFYIFPSCQVHIEVAMAGIKRSADEMVN